MEISIGLKNCEESNLFLRALWSIFRAKFGKCSWLYTPWKDGANNKVYFGFMDIGVDNSYEVYIQYLRRSVVNKLILKPTGKINKSETVRRRIKKCVSEALENVNSAKIIAVSFLIKSNTKPLAPYQGLNFSISSQYKSINKLTINVLAFDKIDSTAEAKRKIYKILDFLSVCTNSVFNIVSDNYKENNNNELNEFYTNFDWIDGFPIRNGKLILWEKEVNFIDNILSDAIDIENGFLRACTHFHKAIRLIEYPHTEQFFEICIVLLVSSLEAASILFPYDGVTCMQCGQVIYSIRKRVLDLTKKFSGSENIKRIIDEYYADRSKYLHTGVLLSDQSYDGISIPLLDKDSESGCRTQIPMKSSKLEEIISYILRNIFLDKLA